MAATFNLVRNSRVFYTTNVNATSGIVAATGFTTTNTFELQVLDGFTFGQTSNADTITISEAGATPTRGQRSFNTSLGQADFSFSTYLRPFKGVSVGSKVQCEESVLWNSLLGSVAIGAANAIGVDYTAALTTPTAVGYTGGTLTVTGATGDLVVGETLMMTGHATADHNTAIRITAVTAGTSWEGQWVSNPATPSTTAADYDNVILRRTAWNEQGTAYAEVTTALSNKNQLVKFGMIMVVDSITYIIDNCCLNQADIQFSLDGIAMVAWTGMGTALRQTATTAAFATTTPFGITGGLTGNYAYKNTAADFITNKLSTVTLKAGIKGSGTAYNLALTGGQVTINNNVTYVTPANLGVVNQPVGYYTGTRAISGNITAYLRTGTTNTAGLLNTLLAASSTAAGIEPQYQLMLFIGGASASTRVELELPMAFVQIPTIDAQAVLSTTINFTAEGHINDGSGIDIENTNELEVRYFRA